MRGRLLLARVHRYVALLVGGVIVVLGLSGSALVFRKEIDDRIYGGFASIEPGAQRVALEQVVGNIRAVLPEARVAQIVFPDRPTGALSVVVSAPEVPWLCFYVDPYTGEILAKRPPGILEALRELHSTLMINRLGRFEVGWYSVGTLGLLCFALCVTGLYLSWPARRGFGAALRINRGLSWKRVNWDLHRVVGILTSVLIIGVSASGSVVVFREAFRPPNDPVVIIPGLIEKDGGESFRRWEAPRLPLDLLLRQAEEALPEGRVVEIAVPADPEMPLSVGKELSGHAGTSGTAVVWLDRRTGEVVKIDGPSNASVASGMFGQMMNAIHTGRVAGLPGRSLVLLAGLAPAVLFATGLLIWWSRRRGRRPRNPWTVSAWPALPPPGRPVGQPPRATATEQPGTAALRDRSASGVPETEASSAGRRPLRS